MKTLKLLSGGAAQGLVAQLRDRAAKEIGCEIEGTFGAVGAMRDKLLAGEPCDVVILTQALIDQLAADRHVVATSGRPVGVVKTGVAVKAGEAAPDVRSADSLRAALLAARGVYFPDPVKATAGIHFMKVLKSLGIATQLGDRLRPFPNGATAMREMAQSTESGLIGCTQVTEILYTQGVQLVGLLPREFELATVYTAAVCTRAQEPLAATEFVRMLAGGEAAPLRKAGGFEAQ
ncbi:MAG: molybdate ABC transporter substrate-binding protein [Ramlibacter sp.]